MTTGNQLYVTHCTPADSVLNDPGYSVRAASTDDRPTLQAAFRYPPYELPIDMWRDLPDVSGSPRRLALTDNPEDPSGRLWAVHSSYLAKDTVGRDRSYFSHLVLLPSFDPLDVLRSWGASGWAKSYPSGATQSLERVAKLPVGKFVNDATVTEFLGAAPTGSTDLCATVCPTRLRADADARRTILARTMHALVLLAEQRDEPRRRVFVHAEPGVVALVLYAAVRLLPATVTDGLTFSTFEPYHRNIRNYKLAKVVGTYLGASDKGLEADLGTTRGVALDTFSEAHSSPELRAPLPTGVSDLIELAARGEWRHLPAVRRAMGADPSGLSAAGLALATVRRKEVEASRPPEPPRPARPVPPPPAPIAAPEEWGTTPATAPKPPTPKPPTPKSARPTPSESPLPTAEPIASRMQRNRKSSGLLWAGLAALVLVVGAAVVAITQFGPAPNPDPGEVARSEPVGPTPAPKQEPVPPTPKGSTRPPVSVPPKPVPTAVPDPTAPVAPKVDPPVPPKVDPPKVDPPKVDPPKVDPPAPPPMPAPAPFPPRPGQTVEWEVAPGVKMVFCWIPPGRAQLGATAAEHAALTRIMPGGKRQVWMDAEGSKSRPNYTSAGFWLGKFEVTQAEWSAVTGSNPSLFDGKKANAAKGMDTSQFPVENVNWHDCRAFVKKLNERVETAAPVFGTRVTFALPHEDEWEYACRGGAGNDRPFHFGGVLDGKQANVDGTMPWGAPGAGVKLGRTARVGSYEKEHPHPWGLCDMHGNAPEWCENIYTPGEDTRVLRGGHWAVLPWECRSAGRARASPGVAGAGLRVCVRPAVGPEPPPVPVAKGEKHPVPPDDELKAARDRLRTAFKAEYDKPAPNGTAALVAKLRAVAKDEKPGTANHYAIVTEIMELSEKSADLDGLIDGARTIRSVYQAPALETALTASLAKVLGSKDEAAEFKGVAASELERPTTADARTKLAKDWLTVTKNCRVELRHVAARRARLLLLEGLASPQVKGLDRVEAEKSLQEAVKEIEAADAKAGKFTLYAGKWVVKYENKFTVEYTITDEGDLVCDRKVNPEGKLFGEKEKTKLARREGVVVVPFAQGKVLERFDVRGDTLVVERFSPPARFPKTPENKAEGTRVPSK